MTDTFVLEFDGSASLEISLHKFREIDDRAEPAVTTVELSYRGIGIFDEVKGFQLQ